MVITREMLQNELGAFSPWPPFASVLHVYFMQYHLFYCLPEMTTIYSRSGENKTKDIAATAESLLDLSSFSNGRRPGI